MRVPGRLIYTQPHSLQFIPSPFFIFIPTFQRLTVPFGKAIPLAMAEGNLAQCTHDCGFSNPQQRLTLPGEVKVVSVVLHRYFCAIHAPFSAIPIFWFIRYHIIVCIVFVLAAPPLLRIWFPLLLWLWIEVAKVNEIDNPNRKVSFATPSKRNPLWIGCPLLIDGFFAWPFHWGIKIVPCFLAPGTSILGVFIVKTSCFKNSQKLPPWWCAPLFDCHIDPSKQIPNFLDWLDCTNPNSHKAFLWWLDKYIVVSKPAASGIFLGWWLIL